MAIFSSVKRWLLLTAVVLLVHLGLLGMVSDTLRPLDLAGHAETTLLTRTVTEPAAQAPLVSSVVVHTRTKPRTKKAQPAAIEPAHQDIAVATPPDNSNAELAPTEPAEPEPAVAAAPQPPPASAPELAKAPGAVAEEPSAKPLRFNPDSLSASTRLIYTLTTSKFPFHLNAELLWRNLGGSYHARLRYGAFGQTRMQTSDGKITNAGLAPERFADKYRSELAAHFNATEGKISFSANTPDMPLLAGAQDRLSVLIQLGALLASEPAHFKPGTPISLQTVGPRSAEVWLFTVMQTETLELPGGSMRGVKLERQPRQPYDQKVEVWLSPQLAYLPVRIRITEANGDSVDQQWQSSESATDNN